MKVVCVVNPKASDGRCLRQWPFIESLMLRAGAQCELVAREGDLRDITMDVLANLAETGENDAIIAAVGGDGTQHAVFNGIERFREDRPEAFIPSYLPIPMGTGNNIAKSIFPSNFLKGATGSIKTAVAAIANGADRLIDLGVVKTGAGSEGDCFLDAFSVGVDPAILAAKDASTAKLAATHPRILSLLKGYPLYAWHGFAALRSFKPVEAEIEVDGEPWYSGPLFNIVVNDTAIYGGVFNLTESPFPDDGVLDAVIFATPADYLRKYLLGFKCLPRA
ncbi:MAG: hypothetical protein KAG97_11765, partial [Victivallales bacterium]|nr:hypothetical protein [Victivallales bacterium]